MKKTTIVINRDKVRGGERVDRWVCMRSHPHPTIAGARNCEANTGVLTDAELLVLFNAEVAAFNA